MSLPTTIRGRIVSFRTTTWVLALVVALGCRLERLPPTGSARDTEAIRGIVGAFHESLAAADGEQFQALFDPQATIVWNDSQPQPVDRFWDRVNEWRLAASPERLEARPVRLEVRHVGGAATAWLMSHWTVTMPDGATKDIEHRAVFLLQRQDERWHVLALLLQRRPTLPPA